jgi:hypothetical protein
MKNRASVRPSPESSIITIISCIAIGCVILVVSRNLLACGIVGIFLFGAVATSLLNLSREEGVPQTIIDFDLDLAAPAASAITQRAPAPADRLRELAALHDEGLITDDEFLFQRDLVISDDRSDADDPPAERLRALAELHDEGLVTDDEFLEKRDRIIAEL